MRLGLTICYAFEGFEKELAEELRRAGVRVRVEDQRLFVVEDLAIQPLWSQVNAPDAEIIEVASISEAARQLKSRGRRWACASQKLHRRSELIQEQVFRVKEKPLAFLSEVPKETWGAWALLSENQLIAAPASDRPFPLGAIHFDESAEPPSRAYLKLWELFTVHGVRPQHGARVLDLGSCPGGWTWVLAQVGCQVLGVDRSPFDEKVARLKGVEWMKKDAFRLQPSDVGAIDWLFSDLICAPERLLELVATWQAAGVRNFVCTLKFKGTTDFAVIERFRAIPGSRMVHLCANKHELTWWLKS